MKKLSILILVFVVGLLALFLLQNKKKPKAEVTKEQPVAVSNYSDTFNTTVNNSLAAYYALSEAMVNWDTAAIAKQAVTLNQNLDSINFKELQKDTVIYETATSYVSTFHNDLETISGKSDLTEKKQAFNSLSQNFYDLLRTVKYDAGKIYLQECPMAFNDEEPGLWLSKTEAIRNPYLGLHHPKYKSGMLECGSVRDSLNFNQGGEKL